MPAANSVEAAHVYFKFVLLCTAGTRSGLCPTVPHFLKPNQAGVVLRHLQLIFLQYEYRQQLSKVQREIVVGGTCSSATTQGNTLAITRGPCSELSPKKKEHSSQTRQKGRISDTTFPPKPCMRYHLKSGFATTQRPSAHGPHFPGP